MGKNKLRKFAEMEHFGCVLQYPFARLRQEGFPLRGRWGDDFFGDDHPIVLELGCGKGEYTVGLARRFPDKNFIGIDIKGARIYTGARQVETEGINNAAFLRAGIEDLEAFFARVLKPGGSIHLKTDSPFLHTFTRRLTAHNSLPVHFDTADLYGADAGRETPEYVRDIHTFYEQQWLGRGKQIKFLSFSLIPGREVENPAEEDIERDDYHAYPRGLARDPGLKTT